MGYEHQTYYFYGVHVPREKYQTDDQSRECEFIDATIRHTPGLAGSDVGHITAGGYDRDELFLCVVPEGQYAEVSLGTFRVVEPHYNRDTLAWATQLHMLTEALGYGELGPYGWVVVPDYS